MKFPTGLTILLLLFAFSARAVEQNPFEAPPEPKPQMESDEQYRLKHQIDALRSNGGTGGALFQAFFGAGVAILAPIAVTYFQAQYALEHVGQDVYDNFVEFRVPVHMVASLIVGAVWAYINYRIINRAIQIKTGLRSLEERVAEGGYVYPWLVDEIERSKGNVLKKDLEELPNLSAVVGCEDVAKIGEGK